MEMPGDSDMLYDSNRVSHDSNDPKFWYMLTTKAAHMHELPPFIEGLRKKSPPFIHALWGVWVGNPYGNIPRAAV